jgi:hypothetical protein
MNKLIFLLLLVFVVGCTASEVVLEETNEQVVELDEDTVRFESVRQDGLIKVNALIEKPSPCHTLDVKYGVIAELPRTLIADVTINPPSGDVMCAQVIAYERIESTHDLFGFNRVQVVSNGVLLFQDFIR